MFEPHHSVVNYKARITPIYSRLDATLAWQVSRKNPYIYYLERTHIFELDTREQVAVRDTIEHQKFRKGI